MIFNSTGMNQGLAIGISEAQVTVQANESDEHSKVIGTMFVKNKKM
jgi:hypothetical protein